MGVLVFIEYLDFDSFIWESLGYMINGQITINLELSSKIRNKNKSSSVVKNLESNKVR